MVLFSSGSFYIVRYIDCVNNNDHVDNHFQKFLRLFSTFEQCCDTFDYCKPIIQIDETFLRNSCRVTFPMNHVAGRDNFFFGKPKNCIKK